jgi:HEAT repeat protein
MTQLMKTRPEDDGAIIQQLVRLGDDALDALAAQFPGPLWFDRRQVHSRVPLGRDISPIARALVAFGDKAYARFPALLRSQNPDVRYYATLFVSDRVYPPLLEPLIERLFDEDPQIRLMVRDTLPHYRRVVGFSKVAERLRSQARDPSAPLKARLAALDAISVLRDAASVPILIELINDSDKQISVPSYRALVAITCQDFGKTVKKWRAWYEPNAGRHRVEWLIESLMHGDQALRGAAGLELQKVTQVYYGYVAAAPKREREQAQKRYWDWWHGEGRSKF